MAEIDFGQPNAYSLCDAAAGLAKAVPLDGKDWRPEFWGAFSSAWGEAVIDENDLATKWNPFSEEDRKRAFDSFRYAADKMGYKLAASCNPRHARDAIVQSLSSTELGKRGKKGHFVLSELVKPQDALSSLVTYENETMVAGSATNPLAYEMGMDIPKYASVVHTDGRKNPRVLSGKTEVAGIRFSNESVVDVKVGKYHPLVWLALKYGKGGLHTLMYLAQNA